MAAIETTIVVHSFIPLTNSYCLLKNTPQKINNDNPYNYPNKEEYLVTFLGVLKQIVDKSV